MENKNNNKLEKRYGLFVAICMVVGIVIGSGIFFKAEEVLKYTDNNMLLGVFSWLLGGLVMVGSANMFAQFATKHSKCNGIVDYAEAYVGKKFAYFLASFLSFMLYPSMTSVLGWVSARYTLELFGHYDVTSNLTLVVAIAYIIAIFSLNMFTPKLSGILQVSATTIKLVPLCLIAVVGLVVGLINGNTGVAFSHTTSETSPASMLSAICACAFAYEGWIIATSINSELKNPKKNLPIALVGGCSVIVVIYVLYFIGLAGAVNIDTLNSSGDSIADIAIKALFGSFAGTILKVFIVVSCVGTLNGLMVTSCRSQYFIAVRNQGFLRDKMAKISSKFHMPMYSGFFGLLLVFLWFIYFFYGYLKQGTWLFNFDSSELPILTTYALYIPIYIGYIKELKKTRAKLTFKDLVSPIIAIICSVFMLVCTIYAHAVKPMMSSESFNLPLLFYLIILGIVMLITYLVNMKKFDEYLSIEEE